MFSKFLDAVNDGISQRSPQVNHGSDGLPPSHRHPTGLSNTQTPPLLIPMNIIFVEVNFHL